MKPLLFIFFIALSFAFHYKGKTFAQSNQRREIHVHDSATLQNALNNAVAGDSIILADGIYNGLFRIPDHRDGTPTNRIVLTGSKRAILRGNTINHGYVLYVINNAYWTIKGFTITNGLKGLMMDWDTHCIIEDMSIYSVGEEAIHLRKFSSNNTISNTEICNTGLKSPGFGEGIYIGSAKNHWDDEGIKGRPDACDSNAVLHCQIGPNVTAESIDIKEGTTGGIIRGNFFDATGISGDNYSNSWVDVKGNGYLLENNTGFNPPGSQLIDGYRVQVQVQGWGNNNVFRNNRGNVNSSGYGVKIQLLGSNGTTTGNKVYPNNKFTGTKKGLANIPLAESN